jgi:NADPH:quinone reductase-like Zn-dependent oxidoreductase
VAALTGGEGAEHVLDIGGAATLDRSLDAVRPGGNIYLIGFLGGLRPELNLEKVFRRAAVLRGLSVGSVAAFRDMNAFIERHAIVPVVDRVFGREELVAALQYMEAGALFGKVALRVA